MSNIFHGGDIARSKYFFFFRAAREGLKSHSSPARFPKGPREGLKSRLVTRAIRFRKLFGYTGRLITRATTINPQCKQKTFVWGLVATGVMFFIEKHIFCH